MKKLTIILLIIFIAVFALNGFSNPYRTVQLDTSGLSAATMNCQTISAWGSLLGLPFGGAGSAAAKALTGLACRGAAKIGLDIGRVIGLTPTEEHAVTDVPEPIPYAPDFPQIPGAPDPTQGIPQLVAFIYSLALWAVGAVVFFQILFGGIRWLTAAGKQGEIIKARTQITNAIIGLILLLSSYVILNTINPDLVANAFKLPPLTGATPGIGSQ